MAKNHFIAGVDIGTQKIKVLVASKNDEQLEIVYQADKDSSGIRRGVVINPEDASDILGGIFQRMKDETGKVVDSVYINIGGSHLFTAPSRGLISVSRADRKISDEDVQRVLQAAQAISLPSNKEIFTAVTREFTIDGEKGIKQAVGLEGVRLEAEVLVLGGFAPYIRNLTQTVTGSELQISDMIPSAVAASRACLTEKQKELGVAIIDIGAGTTDLAVFEEGDLIHLAVLPMGSGNITSDIAIGLKIDVDVAEKIKIEYGSCFPTKKQKKEKIEIGDEEPLVFSRKQLTGIILMRVSEIFSEIQKELKKISKDKSLPGGVVLTGGGAKLPKIVDFAKKEFKLPSRIGKPQGIRGLTDLSLTTCAGLVLLGQDFGGEILPSGDGIISKIKKALKIFVP